MFFFWGENLPNFNLKNIILTYTKDLPWKKNDPNLSDFEKKKKVSKLPDFYDKFQ
jgi:hypothetical protein